MCAFRRRQRFAGFELLDALIRGLVGVDGTDQRDLHRHGLEAFLEADLIAALVVRATKRKRERQKGHDIATKVHLSRSCSHSTLAVSAGRSMSRTSSASVGGGGCCA